MWLSRISKLDVILAVGFLTVGLIEELTAPERMSWWWARLGLATGLVLCRRVVPLSTMVIDVVVVQMIWMPANIENYRVWQAFGMMIGLHTVGREIMLAGPNRAPLWRRVAAVAVVCGTLLAMVSQDLALRSDYFATVIYTSAAWISGLLLQVQARRIAERNAAVAQAEAWQSSEALAQERARIARELHDIVAHSVTVMVLQAGAVRRRLHPDQDAERGLLSTVEDAGRDAVTELRRTLGLLRGDGALALAPQPALVRLDELVEQLKEAGLSIKTTTMGVCVPLPPSLDLSAYRIVQEALTNVLKHSGARTAEVTMDFQPDALHLTIADPGGRAPARPATRGHGLVGMRERVSMFGGRLEANPQTAGGYRIEASLPLPRRADPAPAQSQENRASRADGVPVAGGHG